MINNERDLISSRPYATRKNCTRVLEPHVRRRYSFYNLVKLFPYKLLAT